MNRAELAGAERFITAGLAGKQGASIELTRRANLSTQIGIDVSAITNRDLIAMRRDEALFNYWRNGRDTLAEACARGDSPQAIKEKRREVAAGLRKIVEDQKAKTTEASRSFRDRALIYGTMGAVVTGAATAAAGSMPAILAAAAAGGFMGAASDIHHWWKAEADRVAARDGDRHVAVQKHMLALDTRAPKF